MGLKLGSGECWNLQPGTKSLLYFKIEGKINLGRFGTNVHLCRRMLWQMFHVLHIFMPAGSTFILFKVFK